jgi:hypothetical protein
MLDGTLVFRKTELGSREMGAPSHGLTPRLRRALILVDGVKTVEDLAPLFRPGEIDTILAELQAGGFVMLAGGELADPAQADAPPQSGADLFEEVRRRAVREVSDHLGPEGEAIALAIERCRSREELREALREAAKVLTGIVGAEYGRNFARNIGLDLL